MELNVKTEKKWQVIDITDLVQNNLEPDRNAINVFAAHTTCAVTTADLDPGTDLDLLDASWGMIPDIKFRHPHDPSHAPAHIVSSIIGPGVTIPAKNGELILGSWQRVILVEFDGPRDRTLIITNL